MGKKDRPKKNRYRAVIAIVIAGIVFLTFPRAEERNFRELLMEDAELELLNALCPVIAAAGDNGRLSVSGWIFPFLGYQSKTKTAQLAQENSDMVEKILLAEGRDEYTGMSGDDTEKNAPTDGRNLSLEELARLENEQAGKKADKTAWRTAAKPTGAVLHPTAKGKAAAGSKPDLAIVKTKPATQQIAPVSAILQPLSRRSSVLTTGRSLRVMMRWCGNVPWCVRERQSHQLYLLRILFPALHSWGCS